LPNTLGSLNAKRNNNTKVKLTATYYLGNIRGMNMLDEAIVDEASPRSSFTAFAGMRRIASGGLAEVAVKIKQALDRDDRQPVLIFDDVTSEQIELDLRGSIADVRKRIKAQAAESEAPAPKAQPPRGAGRPKLGVVGREVTLLPRHWEWLAGQPGGASVALRKLVDEARKGNQEKDRRRRAQDAAYRFMSAIGGNLPGFEEAIRALFSADPALFAEHIAQWPSGVREHARKLAQVAFVAAA
jgi:hypothetical protein